MFIHSCTVSMDFLFFPNIAGHSLELALFTYGLISIFSFRPHNHRPGGLSDAQAEGPELIHVSQGDVYSSEITRKVSSRRLFFTYCNF